MGKACHLSLGEIPAEPVNEQLLQASTVSIEALTLAWRTPGTTAHVMASSVPLLCRSTVQAQVFLPLQGELPYSLPGERSQM